MANIEDKSVNHHLTDRNSDDWIYLKAGGVGRNCGGGIFRVQTLKGKKHCGISVTQMKKSHCRVFTYFGKPQRMLRRVAKNRVQKYLNLDLKKKRNTKGFHEHKREGDFCNR